MTRRLAALALVACAAGATPARADPSAVRRASGVIASALSVPVGRATGAKGDGVRELLGNAWHPTAGARLLVAPRVRLAIDLGLELGQAGPAQRRVCAALDRGCLLLGGTVSFDVELVIASRRRAAVWGRGGIGAEAVSVGAVTEPPEVLLVGFDFLRPGVGADWRLSEHHSLGLFTQVAVGTYAFVRTTSDLDGSVRPIGDQALHARVAVGARWVFE